MLVDDVLIVYFHQDLLSGDVQWCELFMDGAWAFRAAMGSSFMALPLGLRREREVLLGALKLSLLLHFTVMPSLALIYFSKQDKSFGRSQENLLEREWQKPPTQSPLIRANIVTVATGYKPLTWLL